MCLMHFPYLHENTIEALVFNKYVRDVLVVLDCPPKFLNLDEPLKRHSFLRTDEGLTTPAAFHHHGTQYSPSLQRLIIHGMLNKWKPVKVSPYGPFTYLFRP
jgi:hypothetical protein